MSSQWCIIYGISNHWQFGQQCLHQRKHQSLYYWPFMKGIHRSPVDSLHKWPVKSKAFPCYDVIVWFVSLVWHVWNINTVVHMAILQWRGLSIMAFQVTSNLTMCSSVSLRYRRHELTIPLSWASERDRGRGSDRFLDKRSHCFRGVWKWSIQEAWDSLV